MGRCGSMAPPRCQHSRKWPRREAAGSSARGELVMNTMRTRLMSSSVICGAAVLGLATQAAAAEAAAGGAEVSEIVVTGTRIPTPNLSSVAPVTSVSSADIKAQGVSRVEDLINSLPQAFASQGSNVSNNSNGTA